MSLSMSTLVAAPIPTPSQVQDAARALGFDLTIEAPQTPFEAAAGFRPMTFGPPASMQAGVEVYVETASEFSQQRGIRVDPRYTHAIWFRWGSSFEELYSATVICAALAHLGGLAFADEEGRYKTTQELVAEAQSTLRFIKPRKRP